MCQACPMCHESSDGQGVHGCFRASRAIVDLCQLRLGRLGRLGSRPSMRPSSTCSRDRSTEVEIAAQVCRVRTKHAGMPRLYTASSSLMCMNVLDSKSWCRSVFRMCRNFKVYETLEVLSRDSGRQHVRSPIARSFKLSHVRLKCSFSELGLVRYIPEDGWCRLGPAV